jgi:hypothetical protein
VSDKHLERKEVLNLVYTQQAERMADAYARLMADFSQMTAWGRGLESDLSWARAELMQVKAELERVRLIAHDNKQALYNAKAEVERLTKAGDGLYKSMLEIGCNEMADNFEYDAWWGSMKDWNAAKEDKPGD